MIKFKQCKTELKKYNSQPQIRDARKWGTVS